MATYEVEISTTGREVYSVEADSAVEAEDSWFEGELIVQESSFDGFLNIEEVED